MRMLCRMRVAAGVVTLWLAMCAPPAMAKRIALLIAVGKYVNHPEMALSGPPHDLVAMRRVLESKWNFDSADISSLLDDQATRASILRELAALTTRSAPGDTVLIYFSGHGTSARDEKMHLPLPDSSGAWAPYDMNLSGTPQHVIDSLVVGRSALRPVLLALDVDRQVLVLTDSCFSGNMVRGGTRSDKSTSRALPLASPGARRGPSDGQAAPPYPYKNVVMLSASSENEYASDITEKSIRDGITTIDGKPHGSFTDGLLRILEGQLRDKGAPSLDYASVHRLLTQNMARYGELGNQEPQLLPALSDRNSELADLAFLGMGKPAMPTLLPLSEGRAGSSPKLRVRAASAAASLLQRLATVEGVVLTEGVADLVLQTGAQGIELLNGRGDMIHAQSTIPTALARIEAEALWRRMLRKTNGELGLRAEIAPASRGGTFIDGEQLRFALQLNQAASVVLVSMDSGGNLKLLYPSLVHETGVLSAATLKTVPALEDPPVSASAPFGLDLVGVLAFARPPANFRSWVDARQEQLGALLAAAIDADPGAVQAVTLELRTLAK
jgi:hypothetical protein